MTPRSRSHSRTSETQHEGSTSNAALNLAAKPTGIKMKKTPFFLLPNYTKEELKCWKNRKERKRERKKQTYQRKKRSPIRELPRKTTGIEHSQDGGTSSKRKKEKKAKKEPTFFKGRENDEINGQIWH
jgi:hypothetical protein